MEEKLTAILEAQQAQINLMSENFTKAIAMLAEKQANQVQGSTSSANIPWPQPLEVEDGDLQENFKLFENNWKSYCVATGMDKWPNTSEKVKVNILLSVVGDPAKKKYNEFNLTDADKESSSDVMKAIQKIMVSNRNLLYDRHCFHLCDQQEDEEFDAYLLRLRKIVEFCKYDNNITTDSMLRDRIAFGVKDSNLKKKFMQDDPEKLDLQKIIQECKSAELIEKRLDELNIKKEKNVNKVERKDDKATKLIVCKFCDTKHKWDIKLCPAYNHTCKICNKKNHLEAVCWKNEKAKKKNSTRKKVKLIERSEEESDTCSDSEEEIKVIKQISHTNKGPVTAVLSMKFNKWKNVKCELDTGAEVSLIGYKDLCTLMRTDSPPLRSSKYKLKNFDGSSITVKGEVLIRCNRNNEKFLIYFQVVENNHGPLLSAAACTQLGLVKFCKKVKVENKSEMEEICKLQIEAEKIVDEHRKIFEGYGKIAGEVNLEVDPKATPVIEKARRIPLAKRNKLKEELDKLEKEGIVMREEEHCEWVSNIVIVEKGDKVRICLDPTSLNKALKRPNFQATTMEEALAELGDAKVFTKLDMKSGFWHFMLSEMSSKLTCFWTPFGRYRWVRLPFGLNCAPEIFQMRIFQILFGLPGVLVLADDILVVGKGKSLKEAYTDHNKNLKRVLARLMEFNCKLNKDKIELCKASVKFFGHILTEDGVKPDPSKIAAIEKMPQPVDKKGVKRFIGMVTYHAKYIPNLSSELAAIRELTREDVEFRWTDKEDEAFKKIKDLICQKVILQYFDNKKSCVLECDASNVGLGAAMIQDDQVIAYASRALSPAETRYAQIEKELLAVVFACSRFDQFVVGRKIIIKTDHHPLISISKKPLSKAPRRLQSMLLTLTRYNYEFQYIRGKENVTADALSRDPIKIKDYPSKDKFIKAEIFKISKCDYQMARDIKAIKLCEEINITNERIEEIQRETMADETLNELSNMIVNGWPSEKYKVPDRLRCYYPFRNELSWQKGLIFRNKQIVIPTRLQKKMIERVHVAHQGMEYTVNFAKENIFWPGMTAQIKETIKSCAACLKYARNQQKQPMQSHITPKYPFQIVSMDIYFSRRPSGSQAKYLVTVDHYSDFFEIDEMKDLTPDSVIKACKKNFSRHGVPQLISTDNGTHFVNEKFKRFAKLWDFQHSTSSPHHQQGNGKAESAVKVAKSLLKKAIEAKEDFWYSLLHQRNTPNSKGSSPAKRLLSRNTRSGLPSVDSSYLPNVIQMVPEIIERKKKEAKHYYDKKTRNYPDLKIGQPVMVQVHPDKNSIWTPGRVKDKVFDRAYVVEANDSTYRRNRVHIHHMPEVELEEENLNTEEPTQQSENNQQQSEDSEPTSSIERQMQQPETNLNNQSSLSTRQRRNIKTPAKYKDYVMY